MRKKRNLAGSLLGSALLVYAAIAFVTLKTDVFGEWDAWQRLMFLVWTCFIFMMDFVCEPGRAER